jgi:hypothetical protein
MSHGTSMSGDGRPADGAEHGEENRREDDDVAADDLAPEPGRQRHRQREQVFEDAGLAVAGHRAHGGDQHEDRQDGHGQLDVGDQQARQADEAEHARFGQAEEEEQGDDAAEDQRVDLEPAGAQRFDDVQFGGEPQLLHLLSFGQDVLAHAPRNPGCPAGACGWAGRQPKL